ncbi:MAG: hypothetical protein H6742_13635 [Alphaproteobacteria bacterium]|nr:hypothetical protein [Alphaproteobacteria bacterium]
MSATPSSIDRPVAVFGWTGTVAVLVAYAMGTAGSMAADSVPFLVLNLVGSVGIGMHSWRQRALPSVSVNAVWALISVVGLVRLLFTSAS